MEGAGHHRPTWSWAFSPMYTGRLAKKPPFWMDGRRTSGPPSSLRPTAYAYPREELDSPHFPSTRAAGCLTVPERPLAPTRCPVQRHTQHAPSSHLSTSGRWAVLSLQGRREPPYPSLEVVWTPGWFIHHFPPFNTSHALAESSLTTVMSPSCGGSTPAGVDAQVGGPGGAVAVVVHLPGGQLAAGVAAGLSAVGRRGSPAPSERHCVTTTHTLAAAAMPCLPPHTRVHTGAPHYYHPHPSRNCTLHSIICSEVRTQKGHCLWEQSIKDSKAHPTCAHIKNDPKSQEAAIFMHSIDDTTVHRYLTSCHPFLPPRNSACRNAVGKCSTAVPIKGHYCRR